eukprot:TRINITY_DN7514_c0_g1_i6.p1 TRINITY_DN7514_c0_g1~~TRINITY_DN7514_c0_g1_i6.p1  ORF type:complete len:115 (+),score=23.96 TRINITY_DN7514_c0_g1_i6:100-444(+)
MPNRSHSISINKHKSTILFNNSDDEPQVSPASKSYLLKGLHGDSDIPRAEELKQLYRRMIIAKQARREQGKSKSSREGKSLSRSMKENVRYVNNRESGVHTNLRPAKQAKANLV